MKIAILGIYPPPTGGISIYIKRFLFFLNKREINNILYNGGDFINEKKNIIHLRFRKKLLRMIFDKSDIIHSNEIGMKARMVIPIFRFFNKKIILSIHGDSFKTQINKLSGFKKKIFIYQIKKYDHIIVVNPGIKQLLIEQGLNKIKVSVIPAFIPPTSYETDISQLQDFFYKIRKKHKFLITANASQIRLYKDQDLYGIDLSIELMKILIDKGYKNVGFIYVIPDIGDYDYYKKLQNLVKKYNLENNFYFYTKPVAYPAVINMCDLFIRPTNTDGYGVSIAEAISLKTPAIASDVCKRPEGTILFENRNIDDLYSKTVRVIDNYNEEKKKIENIEFEDNAERIIEVYKKVLNEK